MIRISESVVEEAALEWFAGLGYGVGHGPGSTFGGTIGEVA